MVTEEALAVARKPLPSTVVLFQLESFETWARLSP